MAFVMSNAELKMPSGGRGEIVIYQEAQGPGLEVRLEQDSVWLSLNQIAALFERDKSVISRHLRNVFREGELDRQAVVAFYATTATDGKTYQVEYFNLDAILSVGYRVNSKRGTQFRIWATSVLRDHLLYFLVKNHSFVDGNKRIGAALFLWFMEKNGILYRQDGAKRIADNALVAITLMIAESAPAQRQILTHIIVELINDRN